MKRFLAAILLVTLLLSACSANAAFADARADIRDKSFDEIFHNSPRRPTSTSAPAVIDPLLMTDENLLIHDEEDLFTPQEEEELAQHMRPIAEKGCVMVWTTDSVGSVEEKALEYFDNHSREFRTDGGLLLMIDMNQRQVYLLSRGGMEDYVNRSDAYAITADVSHFATDREYAKCAMEALDRVTSLTEGGSLRSPMRIICSILLGLAMGLLAAYLIARGQSMQPMPDMEKRTSTNGMKGTSELENRYNRNMGTKYTIFAIVVIGIFRVLQFMSEMSSDSDSGSYSSSRSSGGRSSSRSSGGGSRSRDSGGSGGGSSF